MILDFYRTDFHHVPQAVGYLKTSTLFDPSPMYSFHELRHILYSHTSNYTLIRAFSNRDKDVLLSIIS